METQKAD